MSRDAEIATYLGNDNTLTSILTGGIYAESVIGGLDGFSRDEGSLTEDAFDAEGFLLPCLMVRDRILVPIDEITDLKEGKAGASQTTELYFYEDRGHAAIDQAKERTFALLQGHVFTSAYPARWMLDTPPVPDSGPLKGNTTIRQDWQIVTIRGN